jgi:ERCC4-related helicase
MDAQFIAIIQKIVSEQGKEVLFNGQKCNAFLAGYTQGKFKKESRLFAQAVEAGIVRAIAEAADLSDGKKKQINILCDDYFISKEIAEELVELICAVLGREETGKKTLHAKEIKVNDIVRLTSNPKIKGAVVSFSDIGGAKQYHVFVDGVIKTFFAGQIERDDSPQNTDKIDIDDLLRTLTARQILSPSSNSLYSLHASRIDFVPYQFYPVLKLIKSETPRLLIADSVGIGKTIEAGLILKELQFRKPLDIVIIICPKPLVAERKWELEMKNKFGEEFTPADTGLLHNIIADYIRDGEWPDSYKRLIIPYSILTEKLLNGVSGKKMGACFEGMDLPLSFFDMVIVDEAHHIRNSYTQTHKVVRFFCEHANAVIFLTATPVQNKNEDLYTLLNLLFPDVVIDYASFAAMAEPNEHINNAVKLLRAGNGREAEALDALEKAVAVEWGQNTIAKNPVYKKTVKLLSNNDISKEQRIRLINDVESLHSFSHMINRTRRQDIEDFCIRRATTLLSEFTEKQKELHDELLQFESEVFQLLHPNIPVKFLICTISRQASSCLFGLAPFMEGLVKNKLSDLFEEYDEDAESLDFGSSFPGRIKEMARRVIVLAENLPPEDPKFDKLAEILVERQKTESGKTIVFSTFRHTLAYLRKRIKADIKNIRVEQVDGSVPDEERRKLRDRFELPRENENALDVLLFSEVGSEGLDYQFCNAMVNYDLPWNPMRIEQRIGRIDRRGQKSEFIDIYNCITNGTIDADIYERCFMKINIFEKSIGELSDILGNIEDKIKDIALTPGLTPEQRRKKLDIMALNEIALMEAARKLEEESKNIFGIDISGSREDIEKAKNPWVSALNVKQLVEGYLTGRLDNKKQYIYGDDKKLKLGLEEKALILEDCHNVLNKKNQDDINWENYLRSPAEVCPITFSQDEAKEKRKNIFIVPSHPLVRQAARYFFDNTNKCTALTVYEDKVPSGEYPFVIYSWEYKGNRPGLEFIPLCADSRLNEKLLSLLQNAVPGEVDFLEYAASWATLEKQHFFRWNEECNQYKAAVMAGCDFKTESLKMSLEAQKISIQKQLEKTGDLRIEIMRKAETARLENHFIQKKNNLEAEAKTADIHTTLIVKGVMIVKGAQKK